MYCLQNNSNCNGTLCRGQSLQGYLDCNPNYNRHLNIVNSSYQLCDCFDGYFDYQGSCELCDSSCLTCQNTATSCLSCDTNMNRLLKINQCDCVIGYNDKLALGQACILDYIGCHYSCRDCFDLNYNQCVTCKELRVLTDTTCLLRVEFYLKINALVKKDILNQKEFVLNVTILIILVVQLDPMDVLTAIFFFQDCLLIISAFAIMDMLILDIHKVKCALMIVEIVIHIYIVQAVRFQTMQQTNQV